MKQWGRRATGNRSHMGAPNSTRTDAARLSGCGPARTDAVAAAAAAADGWAARSCTHAAEHQAIKNHTALHEAARKVRVASGGDLGCEGGAGGGAAREECRPEESWRGEHLGDPNWTARPTHVSAKRPRRGAEGGDAARRGTGRVRVGSGVVLLRSRLAGRRDRPADSHGGTVRGAARGGAQVGHWQVGRDEQKDREAAQKQPRERRRPHRRARRHERDGHR